MRIKINEVDLKLSVANEIEISVIPFKLDDGPISIVLNFWNNGSPLESVDPMGNKTMFGYTLVVPKELRAYLGTGQTAIVDYVLAALGTERVIA